MTFWVETDSFKRTRKEAYGKEGADWRLFYYEQAYGLMNRLIELAFDLDFED
jgi:hypothetical protein